MRYNHQYASFLEPQLLVIPAIKDINIERNAGATMFVHLAIRFMNNQMTIAYTAPIAIVISNGQTVMNFIGKAPIMVNKRAIHITDVNYVLKPSTRNCTRKGTSAAKHIAKLVRITSIQIIYVTCFRWLMRYISTSRFRYYNICLKCHHSKDNPKWSKKHVRGGAIV